MNPGFQALPGPAKQNFLAFRQFIASGIYKPSPGVLWVMVTCQQAASSGSTGQAVRRMVKASAFRGQAVAITVGANGGHSTFGTLVSSATIAADAMWVPSSVANVTDTSGGTYSNGSFNFATLTGYYGAVINSVNMPGVVIIEEYGA